MPTYFMPAKDPYEARDFFQPLVDQGKLTVILANERPDAYDRIVPCDDVKLIIDTADSKPPEAAEFTQVLGEFRPEPIPEDQLEAWTSNASVAEQEVQRSEEDAERLAEPDGQAAVQELEPEDKKESELPELQADSLVVEHPTETVSDTDRQWIPFADRGYKG